MNPELQEGLLHTLAYVRFLLGTAGILVLLCAFRVLYGDDDK